MLSRMPFIFTSVLFLSSCMQPNGLETLSMNHPANPQAMETQPSAPLKTFEKETFNIESSSDSDEKEEHDGHGAPKNFSHHE